jgi:hypothetical protein
MCESHHNVSWCCTIVLHRVCFDYFHIYIYIYIYIKKKEKNNSWTFPLGHLKIHISGGSTATLVGGCALLTHQHGILRRSSFSFLFFFVYVSLHFLYSLKESTESDRVVTPTFNISKRRLLLFKQRLYTMCAASTAGASVRKYTSL